MTVNGRAKEVWVVTYVNDFLLAVRDLTQQRNKETGSEEGTMSRFTPVNILRMGIRPYLTRHPWSTTLIMTHIRQ